MNRKTYRQKNILFEEYKTYRSMVVFLFSVLFLFVPFSSSLFPLLFPPLFKILLWGTIVQKMARFKSCYETFL